MAHFNNEQIRNKLNEGRSIEKSVGYGFMSGLNKKRKRKNENINLFKEGQERTQKKRGVKGKKTSEEENPADPAYVSGDIDGSGTIDVTDLTEVSLALLGDRDLTDEQQKAADVDGDGSLSLADLAKIRQYLSKKIDSLD